MSATIDEYRRTTALGELRCVIVAEPSAEAFDFATGYVGNDVWVDEVTNSPAAHADADVIAVAVSLDVLTRPTLLIDTIAANPDTPVLVLTPDCRGPIVRRAVRLGARGVVCADGSPESFAVAVRALSHGLLCVPTGQYDGGTIAALSARERQMLAGITQGLTNCEIASALFLSESTVKTHVSSAFRKLGVRSRSEATSLLRDPFSGLADIMSAGALT